MTSVLEVRFKGNRREYFTWPSEDSSPLRLDVPVIVEVERGQDFGVISALGEIAAKKCERCGTCGAHPPADEATIRNIVRLATPDDRKTAADLRINEEDVRRTVRDRVRQHTLPMKVSDAEWQWDKRKLTIYFTAEQRVDFRALVRDLAGLFRTRIELRQIGARDEAKRLDGIGRCGRLLCCLHYEHDFYVQQRKRFPKEGKTLQTAEGNARVVSVDIFRERVTLRSDAGETRVVGLDQLRL